jgi:hypothetical protein
VERLAEFALTTGVLTSRSVFPDILESRRYRIRGVAAYTVPNSVGKQPGPPLINMRLKLCN